MKIWLVVELADLYASICNYVIGESSTYYDVLELEIEDLKHLEVEE